MRGTRAAGAPLTKWVSSGPVRPWPLGLGATAVPARSPVWGLDAVAVTDGPEGVALPLSEGAPPDDMAGDALGDKLPELAGACES